MMKKFFMALLISLMALGTVACNDSSAENAGEAIDDAMNDVENKVEDLCEQAKEAAKLDNDEC